jgi:hypothetical protein
MPDNDNEISLITNDASIKSPLSKCKFPNAGSAAVAIAAAALLVEKLLLRPFMKSATLFYN